VSPRGGGGAGGAALDPPLAASRICEGGGEGERQCQREPDEQEAVRRGPAHFCRKTTSRSAPDSAAQTSPGRPRIWRTFALRRSLGNASNFSVSGSKRTTALALHSLSHTLSRSST